MSVSGRPENDLLLVAAVVWEVPTRQQRQYQDESVTDHDDLPPQRTTKLRVYQRDVNVNDSSSYHNDDETSFGILKGKDLLRLLRRELETNIMETKFDSTMSTMLVDIYDASQSAYVSLIGNSNTDVLEEENIVERFGTRLRIHVKIITNNNTSTHDDFVKNNNKPKAIMGRFYEYNAVQGITVAGHQLRVQELSNQQNAGTGVNVWDGALLL